MGDAGLVLHDPLFVEPVVILTQRFMLVSTVGERVLRYLLWPVFVATALDRIITDFS